MESGRRAQGEWLANGLDGQALKPLKQATKRNLPSSIPHHPSNLRTKPPNTLLKPKVT